MLQVIFTCCQQAIYFPCSLSLSLSLSSHLAKPEALHISDPIILFISSVTTTKKKKKKKKKCNIMACRSSPTHTNIHTSIHSLFLSNTHTHTHKHTHTRTHTHTHTQTLMLYKLSVSTHSMVSVVVAIGSWSAARSTTSTSGAFCLPVVGMATTTARQRTLIVALSICAVLLEEAQYWQS